MKMLVEFSMLPINLVKTADSPAQHNRRCNFEVKLEFSKIFLFVLIVISHSL